MVKNIIYKYIKGSTLYGLNTKDSDLDIGGIYLENIEDILGIHKIEEEIEISKDEKYYSLKKFLNLLIVSNPNILEFLFCPEDKMIIKPSPLLKSLFDNKEQFLTKQCFEPFLGYAYTQIKKARGMNKKVFHPMIERKDVLDFCYTFHEGGSTGIKNWLEKRGLLQQYCGLVKVNNMYEMYHVYYDWGNHFNNEYKMRQKFLNDFYVSDYYTLIKKYKNLQDFLLNFREHLHWTSDNAYTTLRDTFIDSSYLGNGYAGIVGEDSKSNEVRLSSIPKGEKPICQLSFNKDGYSLHCKDYREFKEWEEKRNPLRYENTIKAGKGYDCYFEEETEFLTQDGWKKYDDINDDELIGCFNKNRELIYSPILSKTDKIYNGWKYTFESLYIRFSITENHNLFISNLHRNPTTNFSTKYNEKTAKWELISVNDYFNGKRSYYHQIINLINTQKNNEFYSDDFIKLLGMFLSEGNYVWRTLKDGTESNQALQVSQLKNNCGYNIMESITTIPLKRTEFQRKGRIECTWTIRDRNIMSMLKECNGVYCYEKNIPKYVNTFSKRQFDLLLDCMLCGDGNYHKNGHSVYFTTSVSMAKQLHTLLILNGYASQFYGENKIYQYKDKITEQTYRPSYQVFISKKKIHYTTLSKLFNKTGKRKNTGWDIEKVENKRVVCFETTEGTLITKNKNKFAFHGNCKNLMHMVRLMHMAKEIAQGQGFNVIRTWDKEMLMEIRLGKMDYDYLINYAENLKKEIEDLIPTCSLPETVNIDFVNDLLINIRKGQLK